MGNTLPSKLWKRSPHKGQAKQTKAFCLLHPSAGIKLVLGCDCKQTVEATLINALLRFQWVDVSFGLLLTKFWMRLHQFR